MTRKKGLHQINKSFEREIAEAVKHYGLKLPKTEEEIEVYVRLFGNTEVELPDSLAKFGEIFDSVKDFSKSDEESNVWAMAAKGENGDDLPEHVLNKIKNDIKKGKWLNSKKDEDNQPRGN